MSITFPPLPAQGSLGWRPTIENYLTGIGDAVGDWVTAYGAAGDGASNDTAAIQSALNDTSRSSIVVIPPGTYMVDNLTVPAGTTAILARPGAILKRRAAGSLLTVNGSGTVIEGLTVDGQGGAAGNGNVVFIGNAVTDVTLNGCTITGSDVATQFLVYTGDASDRLTVRGCTIYGNVTPQNSDDCLITGCNFLAAPSGANFGVGVWAVTSVGKHANGARVTDNYFAIPANMFAVVPLSRNGADPPRGTVVADNTFEAVGNCFGGISIDTCNDASVTGNTFRVTSGTPNTAALEIAGSNHVTASGNNFDGGGVMAQVVSINNSSDCTLTGNSFRSPSTVGSSSTLVKFFAPSAGTHSRRNIISNNKFVNPSGGNGMIALSPNNATASVDETLIIGNSFSGNASSRGIVLDGTPAAGSVLRTTIQNNHFVTLSQAIRFFQDDQTVVSGNRFASDVTTRFSQGGGTTNIHVENNDFQLAAVVPASQSHFAGERVYHSAPAVGQPNGWVCTVTGTPGTWVALANL